MSAKKRGSIVIDLEIWSTQREYAAENNTTPQYLCRLIKQGKVEKWDIPELGLALVKRKVEK